VIVAAFIASENVTVTAPDKLTFVAAEAGDVLTMVGMTGGAVVNNQLGVLPRVAPSLAVMLLVANT
jgi:hypothetical protein